MSEKATGFMKGRQMRRNPYMTGAPLWNASDFFGRQETLEWVVRELHDSTTNALVLFGQRRIGKTSFLLQLQQVLPADAFLSVRFDLHDQAVRPLGQVLADLAERVADVANLAAPDPLAFDQQGRFFRRTFLPQLHQKLGGERRVVFLLDEFDMLIEAVEEELPPTTAAKALLPFLRRLMSENPWPAFVFIMGKGGEDLSYVTTIFKSASSRELWVLDRKSAEHLIHQATTNGTLRWLDQTVDRILSLTNCHPYLTQLLCKQIWQRAYNAKPTTPPLVSISDIEEAVANTLLSGKYALNWWWDGLRPAEKIYAAAQAEIGGAEKLLIPFDTVIHLLAAQAVRLHKRSVKSASRALVTRRVLEMTFDGQYRFSIELFRRWVEQNKPLDEVKDEIEQNEAVNDLPFFKIGEDYFLDSQWESALLYFQHALATNPLHFHARLYMGQALLELGQIDQAITELEQAYELNQQETKPALVRGLLSSAQAFDKAGHEEGVLSACERILEISPDEPKALARRAAIWIRRGDVALAKDDFSAALKAYGEANDRAKIAQVELLQRQQALIALESRAQSHARLMQWAEAHAIYEQLQEQAEGEESRAVWQAGRAHCLEEQELAHLFDEGVAAMQQEKWQQAVAAFLQVVNRRVGYQKDGHRATQLLHEVALKTPPISFPAPFFPLVPPPHLSGIRRELPVRTYRNFDLRLAKGERNQLLVEVLNAPAGEGMGRALISESIEWELEQQLRSPAQELGSLLMPGEVRHSFFASLAIVNQSHEGLRIRLHIHDEALSSIPWEAARIGEEYLSLQPHTPLVRYVRASEPPSPLAVRGSLQVLGIISNPKDLPKLNVSLERSRLEEALQPLIKQERVNLTWLPRADTQLLQDALRQGPHVLHFIGHGQYDDDSQKDLLWFTDADGHAEALSADWLATLLRGTSVRFVFLNACESGRAAGGLASVLVRRGIPAVLGMQTAVSDEAAIALAAGFYKALRDGWPVDAALVEGRKAIVNAVGNESDKADWTYPVLYMRAPDGRLFE